jgi:hypothetical protein
MSESTTSTRTGKFERSEATLVWSISPSFLWDQSRFHQSSVAEERPIINGAKDPTSNADTMMTASFFLIMTLPEPSKPRTAMGKSTKPINVAEASVCNTATLMTDSETSTVRNPKDPIEA